ncbi:MAG TPA: hypothetical protein VKU77_33750 [Streptosporangiaceae bacterium]|nr:hypothetical protein [Streptosporangiaceae bacterium]
MGTTPQDAQRNVKGAPDTTRPAATVRLPQRTPTHCVQGPARWENGRDTVSTPAGPPPLHRATANDARPPEQR